MSEVTDRSLTVPDGMVGVRDYGGSGQVLVLIHGHCGSAADWDLVAPHLLPRFRVLAIDLRGHGQTVATPCHAHTVGDLQALVTELDLTPPVVVGHSSAGVGPAIAFASGNPCRGVVNLDGPVGDWAELRLIAALAPEPEDQARREAELWAYEASPDEHEAHLLEQNVISDAREPIVRRRYHLQPDGVFRRRPTVDEYVALVHGENFSLSALVAELAVPMLVLLSVTQQRRSDELGRIARAKRTQAESLAALRTDVTVEHLESGGRVRGCGV